MSMVTVLDSWLCLRVPAGSVGVPSALPHDVERTPAIVPGTAAAALRSAGSWTLETDLDFDADDWWFTTSVLSPVVPAEARAVLRLEGLATLADIFLDDTLLYSSESMFLPVEVDVTDQLRSGRAPLIAIRFRSLRTALAARRPRPRWRPRLMEHQSLRFFRTTLLGRMPSWCPPVRAVGPWRPVTLELRTDVHLRRKQLATHLGGDGSGVLEVAADFDVMGNTVIAAAMLQVDGAETTLRVGATSNGAIRVEGNHRIAGVERWWPHTHGPQRHYRIDVRLTLGDGRTRMVPLGQAGFREIAVERDVDGSGFGLRINDVPVFCRGACWTPVDLVSLSTDDAVLEAALRQVREAGLNMIRVGGTMVYESDRFYELCDALGILVWQDFMFANMDYPIDDPVFAALVREEADVFLQRMQGRPSLAVLCGGSEMEQQAAMLGVPRQAWQQPFTTELLAGASAAGRPDVPYLANSPTGGALPFQVDQGVGHYYGVGAYLRPLEDARRAGVRFTSECLAFSNVPDPDLVEALLAPHEAPVHHPRWKRGVPRDAAAGWDFEDARDHYHRLLFGADPMLLRYADMERYLAQARVVTGEIMSATVAEWRRPGSSCRGALVWFLRDLWPGAGWGLLDVTGRPKAAWWYFRRAAQPVTCAFTDEGVNGLAIHLYNDGPAPLAVQLDLTAWRNGEVEIARASVPILLAPRSAETHRMDAYFEGFHDFGHVYRFGPPGHDVLGATLHEAATGRRIATAVQLPLGLARHLEDDLGLAATLQKRADGWWACTVTTRRFAHAVHCDVSGWLPDDDYFALLPGQSQLVLLRPCSANAEPPQPRITALNGRRTIKPLVSVLP
jgi:beta-mannosidase